MNECQFDCGTVSAYLRERESEEDHKVDNLANHEHSGKDFQGYIRVNSRHRVESMYEERFKEMIDEEKVKENEKYLHPGFKKLCGLKGSQLSGGQK